MVVPSIKNENYESIDEAHIAFAGAASGFITRATTQPFDVLKIRFQLQVEPLTKLSSSKYHSILQAISVIAREEGIKAFWKGHVPAQFLSITFGITQFCCFSALMKNTKDWDVIPRPMLEFANGAIAGSTATFVSYPYDTIRTRLVAQNENNKVYKGFFNAYKVLLKYEGFRSFYKGLVPTIVAVAPNAGGQFMFYRFFDRTYRSFFQVPADSFSLISSLASGSLAGLISKIILYPLDLTRKRMQIQGFQQYRLEFGRTFNCTGFRNCIQQIVYDEGILGLFKGLSPSVFKAIATSAINFTVFEQLCYIMSHSVK